ncbi:MAG: InlB B-repeat-containing protein [Oscillospiraceae bacterium]|nr:InlB B-repeat-containing protein [Oscillospiraceae bacterium]
MKKKALSVLMCAVMLATVMSAGLYAFAEDLNVVTVSYYVEGEVKEVGVMYGEKTPKPDNPTKTGYNFKGWRVDSEEGELFDFDTIITEDISLYASWAQNRVGAIFDRISGIFEIVFGYVKMFIDYLRDLFGLGGDVIDDVTVGETTTE